MLVLPLCSYPFKRSDTLFVSVALIVPSISLGICASSARTYMFVAAIVAFSKLNYRGTNP